MHKYIRVIILGLLLALASVVAAQAEPSVTVADQISMDGTVIVDEAVSDGPGWIVIHADNGEGAPGPVIGFRPLNPGVNSNIIVPIDLINATSTLFAMLHTDDNEIGTYEFGTVEGADGPVSNDDGVITPAFTANIMQANDQFIGEDNIFSLELVVAAEPGFVVLHADNGEGAPGPVIGFTLIEAGLTAPVDIVIDGDATDTLFPMLHLDTGEAGVYEFGTVEGADGPVVVDGQVATFPVVTVPNMRVPDQIAFGSDAMSGMSPAVRAEQVLSDGPGWVVVHADNGEGAPGPVLGFAPVQDGTNLNVVVELDTEGLTPVLFPMLHVDTGEESVYEFGTVEGADGPVIVNDAVLTFPIEAAPSITYNGMLDGTTLTIEQAVIDGPGWLVIHADNGEGAPGPVIGFAPIMRGTNIDIAVELDEAGMTDTLFPMLHYDTGEFGVYEFGAVDNTDGPVVVLGNVVTGPLTPEAMME